MMYFILQFFVTCIIASVFAKLYLTIYHFVGKVFFEINFGSDNIFKADLNYYIIALIPSILMVSGLTESIEGNSMYYTNLRQILSEELALLFCSLPLLFFAAASHMYSSMKIREHKKTEKKND